MTPPNLTLKLISECGAPKQELNFAVGEIIICIVSAELLDEYRKIAPTMALRHKGKYIVNALYLTPITHTPALTLEGVVNEGVDIEGDKWSGHPQFIFRKYDPSKDADAVKKYNDEKKERIRRFLDQFKECER